MDVHNYGFSVNLLHVFLFAVMDCYGLYAIDVYPTSFKYYKLMYYIIVVTILKKIREIFEGKLKQ